MKKIQISQDVFTLVDDDMFKKLSGHGWMINKGYVFCKSALPDRRMHRIIIGAKRGEIVDHIDGDPLNNQLANLRIVTRHENQGNRRVNKTSLTGYRGVAHTTRGFIARLNINGKLTHLGTFKTVQAAAAAYNKRAREYFGKFAKLNDL